MPKFLTALLQSRKFWIALFGVIGSVILYVQGAIPPEQLSDAIVALVGILMSAIALEDAAQKYGK